MLVRVNNKVVGYVDGNTFKKKLSSRKHFLRKPPSIAFDVSSINNAQILGAENVEITDTDLNIIYTSSVDDILSKGFRFNRGYGNQIALNIEKWKINNLDE